MDLTHRFTVPASVEDTWAAFNDIESVAGCFPGATVTSVEGEEFKGSCKVKLGPIALVYSGTGKFLEREDSEHRFVIEAKGKDKRGNGTAGATVTAVMTSAGASSTDVEVRSDLSITGKPAQFGRGVIQDVSDKLLQQFVSCLESTVGAGSGPGSGSGSGPEPGSDGRVAGTGDGDASTGGHAGAAMAAAPARDASDGAAADQLRDSDVDGATGGESSPRKAPASTYSGATAGGEPGGAGSSVDGSDRTPSGGSRSSGSAPVSDDALDLGATVLPILLKSYWKPLVGALLALLVLRKLIGRRR